MANLQHVKHVVALAMFPIFFFFFFYQKYATFCPLEPFSPSVRPLLLRLSQPAILLFSNRLNGLHSHSQ